MMRKRFIKAAPNLNVSRVAKPTTDSTVVGVTVNKPNTESNSELPHEIPLLPTVQGGLPSEVPQVVSPPEETRNVSATKDKENLNNSLENECSKESTNKDQVSSAANEEPSHAAGPSVSRFKARSKVPTVIRGATQRVRTFSSASESEDDPSKRPLRVPLSPVKKASQKESVTESPVVQAEEPVYRERVAKIKEKTQLQIRKEALRRKIAASGGIDQLERHQMTMFDLIYLNPTEPGKEPRQKEQLQFRLKPYELAEIQSKPNKANDDDEVQPWVQQREEEDNAMMEGHAVQEEEEFDPSEGPVPQIEIGPDGTIKINEKSLVIDTSDAIRNKSQLANAPLINESNSTLVNYGSWRKNKRSAKWSRKETARFYRALSMLGTQFSLMERLFPHRKRYELKRKFKTEEKENRALIDKTISHQIKFDLSHFEDGDFNDSTDDASTVSNASAKVKTPKPKGRPKKVQKNSSVDVDDPLEGPSGLSGPQPKKRKMPVEEENDTDDDTIENISQEDVATPSPDKGRGKKLKKNSSSKSSAAKGKSLAADNNIDASDGEIGESGCKKPTKRRKKMQNSVQEPTNDVPDQESAVLPKKAGRGRKKQSGEEALPSKSMQTKTPRTTKSRAKEVIRNLTEENENVEDPPLDSRTPTKRKRMEDSAGPIDDLSDETEFDGGPSTPLQNLMQSPLGQMCMQQGGLTVIHPSGEQTPSLLVPPVVAEANPMFAQAQPGNLLFVTSPNAHDPDNQHVHVYRISVPLQPIP